MTVASPLSRLHSILDQFGARLAIALVLLLSAGLAQAAEIYVDGVACQLSDAITAANTDQAQYGCAAGAGADTLILTRDITLQLGTLPSITSDIHIEYGGLAAQEETCDDQETREDPTPTTDPNTNPTSTADPRNNPTPTDDPSNNPTPTDDPSNNPTPTDDPSNNPTPTDDPSNNPTPTDDPSNNLTPTDDPSNNPTPTADPNNNPTPPDPNDPPEQTFFQPTDPPTISDPDATLTVVAKLTLTAPGTVTATATLPPGAGGDPEANAAPGIPERCMHVVALGENLYRIALQYDISLRDFSTFNRLSSDDQLIEGQRLIIPYEDCLQFAPYKG